MARRPFRQGKEVDGRWSTSEPEPQSCWECHYGKILRLPDGVAYVDCPPPNWKWQSCATRLLNTIQNPSRSLAGTLGGEGSSEEKD